MKIPAILLGLVFTLNQALAQQNHFVYIESETRKPFYARVGQKSFSSSAAGYLILPKLSTGRVDLQIGFPKNEWAPQPFVLDISGDAGYLLRNTGESGWELISLQDFKKIAAGKRQDTVQASVNTANQVSDSTQATVKSPIPEPVNTPEPPAKEVVSINAADIKKPVIPASMSVERMFRTLDDKGFRAAYSTGERDTVDVSIDIPALDTVKEKEAPALAKANQTDKTDTILTESPAVKPVFEKDAKKAQAALPADCRMVAGMEDFLRLRKNMASQRTEDAMTSVAKKFLQAKCITVQQVSNLVVLYLTDQGKYGFLDVCYPHVADAAQFTTLEKQLTDPYYINRFRAMLR